MCEHTCFTMQTLLATYTLFSTGTLVPGYNNLSYSGTISSCARYTLLDCTVIQNPSLFLLKIQKHMSHIYYLNTLKEGFYGLINQSVCMYVRMYICPYVCTYIRTHVCIYVCVCICVCLHACMWPCMQCMVGWMDGCKYTFI